MKELKLGIGYHTDDYCENPSDVIIRFTPELIEKIKLCQQLIKDNDLESIVVTKGYTVVKMWDGEVESEFPIGFDKLIIGNTSLVYWADHDHSSASQIESELFTLDQLR